MNNKHRKTLIALFAEPVRSGSFWTDIESLFISCGGEVSKGRGWCVRVASNEVLATFRRPHPQPTTEKGAVKCVR